MYGVWWEYWFPWFKEENGKARFDDECIEFLLNEIANDTDF